MHDGEKTKSKCLCGEPVEERWNYCPVCGRQLSAEWVLGYDPLYPNRGLWRMSTNSEKLMTTSPEYQREEV